jgi:hypothetical protein
MKPQRARIRQMVATEGDAAITALLEVVGDGVGPGVQALIAQLLAQEENRFLQRPQCRRMRRAHAVRAASGRYRGWQSLT